MSSIKAILEPVSIPDLETIPVEGRLFPIGRTEPFFVDLPQQARDKLSRRHARIFEEQGELYITDLGSLNGTSLNGRGLEEGQPQALKDSDLIDIAGDITFRIRLTEEDRPIPSEKPCQGLQLVMEPVDSSSLLDAIVVTQFPFLIARKDSIFEGYNSGFADQVGQISRRHAVVTRADGKLYLEDLGSKNGTSINGNLIGEHNVPINNGDTLAIGGDFFVYRLIIPQTEPVDAPSEAPVTEPDMDVAEPAIESSAPDLPVVAGEQTLFVDSPTSFLDIFCAEDDVSDSEDDADKVGSQNAASAAGSGKPAGRMHGGRVLAGEFREALDSGEKVDRRKIWAGAGAVVLALIVVLTLYFLDIDRREIKELLDASAYAESAAAGNRYLKGHTDDEEAGAWALEALMKAIVPDWIEHIEQGNYDAADAYLITAAQNSQFIPHGQEMIDILALAGKIEAYIADRGEGDTPIVIFRHEFQVKELVEQWNIDPTKYQKLLSQIAVYVPSFEPVHAQILSDLRMLRNENSLYGKAITALKSDINNGLQKSDYAKISSSINEFSITYPRVIGLDALRKDAERYETLANHVEQQDLAAITRFQRESGFQTLLFEDYVHGWLDTLLPPADILERYDEAAGAWHMGKAKQAIGILEPLTAERWGDVAASLIEQHRRVDADYRALQNARESEDYSEHLIAFRASLDPSTDVYYLQAIDGDFLLFKKQSLAQLDVMLNEVREQWEAYRNAGGITAATRVEERVSDRFKTQANRLSVMYEITRDGTQVYNLIQVKPPPAWQVPYMEIGNEVKRQRRWLEDLGLVLEPTLLNEKLDLLPMN